MYLFKSRCSRGLIQIVRRNLHLHEYQSMEIMQKYGAKTPRFFAASTPEEAKLAAQKLSGKDFVIKAQVHTGGRGLGYFKETGFAGGVHMCTTPEQVEEIAKKMLGSTLITKQTGEEGKPCDKVLITERVYIRQERYLALLMDRDVGGALLLGSSVGGTSIEDIAHRTPEAIVKLPLPVNTVLDEPSARAFAKRLKFQGEDQIREATKSILSLYRLFQEKDCLLVEVNPFAETNDGRIMICDAKVNFDDNAEFRQKEVFAQRDWSQMDKREVQAAKAELNYIGLTGNIGCMVNGAGLAMATMDLIQLCGGSPANFLDVGGGAQQDQIVQALALLNEDPKVDSILINIFGGIMRCDIIAKGLIEAVKAKGNKIKKPLVVRLEGTNKDIAKKLLNEASSSGNLKATIYFEPDLRLAAEKAVNISKILAIAKSAQMNVKLM